MLEPIKFIQIPLPILQDPRLKSNHKFVYGALLYFCAGKTFCFPGTESILRLLHTSERTVRRSLTGLVKFGLVKISDQRDQGRTIYLPQVFPAASKKRRHLRAV